MKKIISIIILLFFIQTSVYASYMDKQIKDAKKNKKYNTVQTHKKNYQNQFEEKTDLLETQKIKIKDPELIKLPTAREIDSTLYAKKIAEDEKKYTSDIKKIIFKRTDTISLNTEAVDFYNIYRISERIIRANGLDYVNWRISIRKSEDFNAYSGEGNYIIINTALYDTLYNNNDALAFVIAHEMAHHILGHSQRMLELYLKVEKAKRIWGSDSLDYIFAKRKFAKENKMMEYMADAESYKLLTKAGYSKNQAMEAMIFMQTLPSVDTFFSDHPMAQDRIDNVKEYMQYANPNWELIGKYNIYNSEVLDCKKSTDRVSIVISSSKSSKDFYEVESVEQLLTRMSYVSYKNGNMKNSLKYFRKLAKYKKDYITYLYISYANQYLYEQTKDEKYLSRAEKAVEKAKSISSNNKYVKEQYEELGKLRSSNIIK